MKQNGFIWRAFSSNGNPSSKRLITLLAFINISIAFYASLFFKIIIDPVAFEAMKWVVLGGLGVTATEAFSSSGKTTDPVVPEDTEVPPVTECNCNKCCNCKNGEVN